jgi:hypothetical protein
VGICATQFLFAGEGGVGFRVVLGLALSDPLIQLTWVSIDCGFFLVLVAMDREPFGRLPALHSADFPAEMGGNLLPRNQFLLRKGRPFGTWRDSVFRHCLECNSETMDCADYTLRN